MNRKLDISPPVSDRSNYRQRFEKALVAALGLALICSFLSRSWYLSIVPSQPESIVLRVESVAIPQTKQGVRRPQPIRPAVPIPVETDIIPEDVTIAPTTLDLNMASVGSMGGAPANEIYQARPLAFVFPQYPEEERKRGVRGEIKVSLEIDEKGKVVNVTILSNDTGSELCAQAAMKAAFATRFAPARDKKGPVTSWLILPYRFDYQK